MSQLGSGTIAVVIGGDNALYTSFKNKVDEDNGDEHFREVIVAKRYTVTPPFPWSDTGGVGANVDFDFPHEAEEAGKHYILGAPNGSNYQVDRYWVESTAAIDKGLTGYPTPQNAGYSFVKAVHLIEHATSSDRALIALYSKTISSSKKDYRLLIATPNSNTPASVGSRCEDVSMSNPSGADFEDEAENLFGAGNFERSVLDERITKLAAYQSFPSAWF